MDSYLATLDMICLFLFLYIIFFLYNSNMIRFLATHQGRGCTS